MNLGSLMLVALFIHPAAADNQWPSFQNGGKSTLVHEKVRLKWGIESGIAWSARLEGYGPSTPLVWRNNVYVTTCAGKMKEKLFVRAVQLETGKTIWQREFANSTPEKNSNYISRAAPTPVADERGLIVFFEGGNLIALDHAGGERWKRNLVADHGPVKARHGLASSLEQDAEHVYVWVERSPDPYVVAIDKNNGETAWKSKGVGSTTWSSPRLIQVGKRQHLVLSAMGKIVGLDSGSGKRLWEFDEVSNNTTPTPVPAGDSQFLLGASEGRGEATGKSFKSNGLIRITKDNDGRFSANFVWRAQKATCSFGSPIVAGGNAYFVNRAGVLHCLDAKTGKPVYANRIAESIWATPLNIGPRLYFFGKDGTTTVVATGNEFQVLAKNTLWKNDPPAPPRTPGGFGGFGGPVLYAVSVADNKLLLRRGDRLYCIAAPDKQ